MIPKLPQHGAYNGVEANGDGKYTLDRHDNCCRDCVFRINCKCENTKSYNFKAWCYDSVCSLFEKRKTK
jgi:hypothetical protein